MKNSTKGLIVGVGGFLFGLFYIWNDGRKNREIDNHEAFTQGVITSYAYNNNMNIYTLKYKYKVNDKEYFNSYGTEVKLNCGKWCKGYTYRVRYSSKIPEYSEMMLNMPIDTTPENPWGGVVK